MKKRWKYLLLLIPSLAFLVFFVIANTYKVVVPNKAFDPTPFIVSPSPQLTPSSNFSYVLALPSNISMPPLRVPTTEPLMQYVPLALVLTIIATFALFLVLRKR